MFVTVNILTKQMYTNSKIRIYSVGIYLLKVINENSRCVIWCVICSKLTKKKTPERLHWHEDIKKHWNRSGVSIINFEKIPQLFLVFISWISGSDCCRLGFPAEIKVQTSKNYETCKDRRKLRHQVNQVKLQHEKKPALNLISIQSVGFEQTFMKFIEIFVPQK